jgi:hypothetical protein
LDLQDHPTGWYNLSFGVYISSEEYGIVTRGYIDLWSSTFADYCSGTNYHPCSTLIPGCCKCCGDPETVWEGCRNPTIE